MLYLWLQIFSFRSLFCVECLRVRLCYVHSIHLHHSNSSNHHVLIGQPEPIRKPHELNPNVIFLCAKNPNWIYFIHFHMNMHIKWLCGLLCALAGWITKWWRLHRINGLKMSIAQWYGFCYFCACTIFCLFQQQQQHNESRMQSGKKLAHHQLEFLGKCKTTIAAKD